MICFIGYTQANQYLKLCSGRPWFLIGLFYQMKHDDTDAAFLNILQRQLHLALLHNSTTSGTPTISMHVSRQFRDLVSLVQDLTGVEVPLLVLLLLLFRVAPFHGKISSERCPCKGKEEQGTRRNKL